MLLHSFYMEINRFTHQLLNFIKAKTRHTQTGQIGHVRPQPLSDFS